MSFLKTIFVVLLVMQFALGCRNGDTANTSAPKPTKKSSPKIKQDISPGKLPGKPQPKLQTINLLVGTNTLVTELAITHPQVQMGMMFRSEMAENEAMLFIFERPHQAGFWMKNTYVPLSCAYINSDGIILELHDMEPLNEESIRASSHNIRYVLEVNQGWFERHGVRPGFAVSTESGTLDQKFFRRR